MAKKIYTTEQLAEIEFHYKRYIIYYNFMMEQYLEPKYHQSDIRC